jgi:hypothetical protein
MIGDRFSYLPSTAQLTRYADQLVHDEALRTIQPTGSDALPDVSETAQPSGSMSEASAGSESRNPCRGQT